MPSPLEQRQQADVAEPSGQEQQAAKNTRIVAPQP